MKIGTFGDLHGTDPTEIIENFNYEKVDVILANGDFISCKNRNLESILESIVGNSNSLVVIIPGNYEEKLEWRDAIKKLEKEYNNVIDNHKKKFEFQDYTIVSYGGGTIKPSCATEIFWINPTNEVNELVPKMMSKKTILQLHEPPKYYGDLTRWGHVGNEWLTYLIEGELEAPKPRLVVAGHIHEARTVMRVGDRKKVNEAYNLFINPGAAKDGHYAIIEIDDSSTRVHKSF